MTIFLFSIGGFAHQLLSGLIYALGGDTFAEQEIGTARGLAGMAGYIGGLGFSLIIGQLASTIGYGPLFACPSVFEIAAFLVIFFVLGERGGRGKALRGEPDATTSRA